MTTSRTIIFTTLLLLASSVAYLSYDGWKTQQYDYSASWWTLYFSDPKTNDLSFTIENHSSETAFHWEILLDKNAISKGDVNLKLGEQKSIPAIGTDVAGRKVTIRVSTPKSNKEIFKKF